MTTVLLLLNSLLLLTVQAQPVVCPANIDFEYGNLTNWECLTGNVTAVNNQNTVSLTPALNGVIPGRIELIGPGDNSLDPIGNFPRHCPNGSKYSIKLGNNSGGAQAEGISYTIDIPATATKFSLLYHYAIVLESPNHSPFQQPRFRARIVDVALGSEISCVAFDFTASNSLPGFQTVNGVVYKNWTPVSVDLSSYAGKTIRLEFITSDCTANAHFGYAYIDVDASCSGTIQGSTYCEGDPGITLTAPFGYQSYTWYSDVTFNQQIGNTQTLALGSGTNVGSVFPVIVNPYPSFGCLDTLYAVINRAPKPVTDAGLDQTICSKQPVRLGKPPDTGFRYAWSPAGLVDDPALANPYSIAPLVIPVELMLQKTDLATGCIGMDTVRLTPTFVDTASLSSGPLVFCPNATIQTTLQVTGAGTQIRWMRDNILLPGQTGSSYRPLSPGHYQAEITQGGCIDSSRLYTIRYTDAPTAGFTMENQVQCLDRAVALTNTSNILNGEPLTHTWRFDDGTVQQTVNALKAFSITGPHTVSLVVRSAAGCTDSTSQTIQVATLCRPLVPSAFTPNADGRNDRLVPYLSGVRSLVRFAIYNRFGNQVYTTTSIGAGWNGTSKGSPVIAGAYIWVLEYLDMDNRPVTDKGTVMLIR